MTLPSIAITQKPERRRKRRKRNQPIAYLYISPALLSIIVLSLIPMAYTIYIAFTNFNMYHFTSYQFVGLKNFQDIIAGPYFGALAPAAIWTFVFAVSTTLLNYLVGLFLAVLLHNKLMRESNFYRTLLIIPWAIPALISQLSWQGLLNADYGQINALLGVHIPWLTDPFMAKVSVILVNLWLGYPYMMSVCLGALSTVPTELYEASSIDGANWWQQFTKITIPALWKVTLPLIIPSFAFNFNNYNAIYLLTKGGPPTTNQFAGSTDILLNVVYNMTKVFNRFDLAAALSIIVFVIVAILSAIQMKASGAFAEVD